MNTIDPLSDWFLSATARGSLLILAVLLAQAAFGRSLPAVWRHALWLPVLFVLGAPVLPESPWSLENRWTPDALPPVALTIDPAVPDSVAPAEGFVVASMANPVAWHRIAGFVWIGGALATFLIGWIACRRTLRDFRLNARPLTPAMHAEIREAALSSGLRRVPRVLFSSVVPGPAMTGLLRPLLLLPASFDEDFDPEERRLIFLHEFTHLKRGDLLLNAIVFVLQALHWCNPLVWFAFARFRADREIACDSAVLSATGEDRCGIYGHALLKLESAEGTPSWRLGFIGLVGLMGRGRILRSRIEAIAGHRKAHPASAVFGIALLLTLALVGATRAQNESAAEPGKQILIETKFIEVPTGGEIEIFSK